MNKIDRGVKQMKFETLIKQTIMRLLPTKWWVKIDYRFHMGKSCDLKNPQTFNEKLCWMKVYYGSAERGGLVDKYLAKQYIADKIGPEYVVKTLGVWDRFGDIPFNDLPGRFVLKPGHTSGNVLICKDKSKLDLIALKKEVDRWMRRDFYHQGREPEYKNIKPHILAEELLAGKDGKEVPDYKFFCFDGIPRAVYLCEDRFGEEGVKLCYYDMQWNPLPFRKVHTVLGEPIERPAAFDEMVRICKILSEGFPFIRLDMYDVQGKVYMGEMTFYPDSGVKAFENEDWDRMIGSWIKLPSKKMGHITKT